MKTRSGLGSVVVDPDPSGSASVCQIRIRSNNSKAKLDPTFVFTGYGQQKIIFFFNLDITILPETAVPGPSLASPWWAAACSKLLIEQLQNTSSPSVLRIQS